MDKKIEFRFYLITILLSIVTILGIILLLKTPKNKNNLTERAISGVFGKLNIKKSGIVIEKINGVIQFNMSQNMLGIQEPGIRGLIDRIYGYADNNKIKGMILRINSPGGTVGSVQEIYNAIIYFRKKGKKVVASFGDLAASGGYYVASACDKIVSNPGTITGSIGVIISSPSFVNLFKKIGLGYNVIKSGKHKDILSSYREMTPEEKRLIQGVVDNAYMQFVRAVSKGRKIPIKKIKKYADGRIFTGEQAKKIGLVDMLGDLHASIRIIGELTGLGKNPNIIRQQKSPIQQLIGMVEKKKNFAEAIFHMYEKSPVPIFYIYHQ